MRQRTPVPAWARRRNQQRAAERAEHFNNRLGAVVGASMFDIVWSNDTLAAYHVRCRATIPHGPLGTVDLGVAWDDDRFTVCARCGEPLREP